MRLKWLLRTRRPLKLVQSFALEALAVFLVIVVSTALSSAQTSNTGKGVLKFGYSTGPTSFDPARSTSGGDRVYLFPVYDRLVRLDNTAAPQAMLATRWEFKNDGKSLVLTLRDGVRFQDGASVDAGAVKANLDRFRTLPTSTQKATLRAITEVKILDASHLEIACAIGCGGLVQTLGGTAGMMVSPAAFNNPELGSRPFGAGPYRLTEYQTGSRANYAPVQGYYDPSNQTLGGLQINILPNDVTRLNALRSGQIDMTFLRPYQVAEAKAGGLDVVGSHSFIWYYMGMNMN